MRKDYIVRIHRLGFADLDELVTAATPENAAAVIETLLRCNDPFMLHVVVTVRQHVDQEKTLLPPPCPEP